MYCTCFLAFKKCGYRKLLITYVALLDSIAVKHGNAVIIVFSFLSQFYPHPYHSYFVLIDLTSQILTLEFMVRLRCIILDTYPDS